MADGSRRVMHENDRTPGCMQSLLHFLDLHQRLRLRKTLAYRRDSSDSGIKPPKRKTKFPSEGDKNNNLEKAVNILSKNKVEEFRTKNKDKAGSRSSPNALVRSLISRKRSREKDKKQNINASTSQIQRTLSIHHHLKSDNCVRPNELTSPNENSTTDLDSDDTDLSSSNEVASILLQATESPTIQEQCRLCRCKSNTNGVGQDELDEPGNHLLEKQSRFGKELDEAKESLSKQKAADAKQLEIDAALLQSKEFMDMMQLFSANRELFLKFLQDPTFIFKEHAQNQTASIPAQGLTKSGSFPGAGWSHRNSLPSLDHIQKENGFTGKKEKFHSNSPLLDHTQQEIKYTGKQEKNLQDEDSSSICNIVDDGAHFAESMAHGDAKVFKAEASTSDCSEPSFVELKNQKNVGNVSRHFKVLKQRIKDVIKENKKEDQRISMDGILHKIPYGRKVSENEKKGTEGFWQGRHDKYISKGKFGKIGLASSSSKHTVKSIRKTSSLTESLGRYSQLLESVSRKESKRSRDLSNLTKQDTQLLRRKKLPKALARMFSLPELHSYSLRKFIRNVSHAQLAKQPTSGLAAGSKTVDPCDPIQLDLATALAWSEESMDLVEYPMKEDVSRIIVGTEEQSLSIDEQEQFEALITESSNYFLDGAHSDVPMISGKFRVTDSYIQEDSLSTERDTISKDTELKTLQSHTEEPDLMTMLQIDTDNDASLMMKNVEQPFDEIPALRELSNSNSSHIQVDERDEAEFQYVRSILLKSGFSSEEVHGEWYLPGQPVDPSLFEEAECLAHDLEITGDDPRITTLKHMLLFDLINEVLLETYDTSFAYCPLVLHADYQIRPLPVGHSVLEEVWAVISKHLSNQLQLDRTVESTVSLDFMKSDGWMNLQHDTEFVGLEVEDLILEDLIDEITFDF